MTLRKNTKIRDAVRSRDGRWEPASFELIAEEPFSIRIDEKPYAVVMRTPGEELFHAAGFCLGEGIIDSPDDFSSIGYDEHTDPNVVDVWLTPQRRKQIPDILRRRSYVSQTSCGICGKRMIDELFQELAPAENGPVFEIERIFDGIRILSEKQQYYRTTRGSHAALILDDRLEAIALAEDVGRHNALDKAIGRALMEGRLPDAAILVLSSRSSHELVQKAARARLPIMISHSRPTTLAVEMARALNMTLGFLDEESGLVIACGEHRIKTARA